MIKAVLYDMDGTVLDTMPLYERAWSYADEQFGLKGEIARLISTFAGMNNADIEAFVLSRTGNDFPYADFRRALAMKFDEIMTLEGIPCKAGAPEIFDRIREMGLRQILVTSSSPKRVFPYLTMAGIANAFDDIVTGDMVVHGKPDPEIFLLGAKKAGCEPFECVVVEDAANGARAGIAAGMKTVMIPEYPPIPEDVAALLWHECQSLAELPDLIRAENESLK